MQIRRVAAVWVALSLGVWGVGCGGCPLLPGDASPVGISPSSACLSLHVEGTLATDTGAARCVDGVTIVGYNGCAEAFVLTPPVSAGDGGAAELTFAPGAAVRFDLDASRGTSTASSFSWSVPASIGPQAVTLTASVPRS
jgi:hypothetical protein